MYNLRNVYSYTNVHDTHFLYTNVEVPEVQSLVYLSEK